MEKKPAKKQISILKKVSIPLIIVALLQPLIFLAVIQGSDVIGTSDREASSAFSEQVESTTEDLSETMTRTWSDLSYAEQQLNEIYTLFCSEKGITDASFLRSASAQEKFLQKTPVKLLETLRRNQTTGIYLVLNSKDLGSKRISSRNGVCIRDLKRVKGYRGPEDLYLERGPALIASQMGFTLDADWKSSYDITDSSRDLFFTMPMLGASGNPGLSAEKLGYWYSLYTLSSDKDTSLSYSIPLISESGTAYGVLGIEISQEYLKKFLPAGELGKGAAYSLATVNRKSGKKSYSLTIPRGTDGLKKNLGNFASFTEGKKLTGRCFQTGEAVFPQNVIYCAKTVQSGNTLISGSMPLVLVGVTSAATLFSFSRQVQNLLVIALFLALAVGLLGILTVSHIISSPIIEMSEKIRGMDDHETARLEGIGISEIDYLVDSINHLNRNAAKNEERLSTILKLTNYPIGVFSIDMESGYVYSNSGLFYILRGLIQPEEEKELSDLNNFVRMLDKLRECPTETEEEDSSVYDIYPYANIHRWIRVRETEQEDSLLGVVTDVTEEVLRKKRIEYERDYDPLTRLINRHAFQTTIEKLSGKPEELGTAAMLMFDVDGLKAINDKYGHDCGDRYICGIANVLRKLEGPNAVVSHISGDEFVALLYHWDSKEEIRKIINQFQEKESQVLFEFPDGTFGKLCVSGGLAWYPADSTDLSILRCYADFTMYQAKEHFCGTICEFDAGQYYLDNLGERRKELKRILTGEGLQCTLHPIVRIVSGELVAFEASIAPKSGVLITDEDLLSLARSQEKLYQVEQINWKTALSTFKQILPSLLEDCKLFLRTVPGQKLLREDYLNLLQSSGVPAGQVIPLVNASECDVSGRGAKKIQALVDLNLEPALDIDACSTANLKDAMRLPFRYLLLSPQITHMLVKNEGHDAESVHILEEAQRRKMRIIARGVSNREEYLRLRRIGIQMLQGPLLENSRVRFPFIMEEV